MLPEPAFRWSVLLPAFAVLVVGWLWVALLPALVRAVHALFQREPERAAGTVFAVLSTNEERTLNVVFAALTSPTGRIRMKSVTDQLYADELAARAKVLAEAVETARSNRDALTQIDFTTKAHGAELREVKQAIGEVPRLGEAFERLSRSMESFADKMESVSEALTRIDEREKVREQERRLHQVHPHPHNRKDD